MSEVRQPFERDHVIFTDQHGVPRPALLTAVHGDAYLHEGTTYYPSVNLVFVTSDSAKRDPYGLQIERESSVVHKGMQSAHGNYWSWPE